MRRATTAPWLHAKLRKRLTSLHKQGWTDREMAEGRAVKDGDKIRQGMAGHGGNETWSVWKVGYWRRKLGLPANREPPGLHAARVRARGRRAAHWTHLLKPGHPMLSDLEVRILDVLSLRSWGSSTRREMAERLGLDWNGGQTLRAYGNTALARLVKRGLVEVGKWTSQRDKRRGRPADHYSLKDGVEPRENKRPGGPRREAR